MFPAGAEGRCARFAGQDLTMAKLIEVFVGQPFENLSQEDETDVAVFSAFRERRWQDLKSLP
jgi:hypothetical protein